MANILDGVPINPQPIFELVGSWLPGGWGQHTAKIPQLDLAIARGMGKVIVPATTEPLKPQVGLTKEDFYSAAAMIGVEPYQIRAFWEVEAAGNGYFTDVRKDILDLDGPGGFIDGDALMKILFEAKWFYHYTGGKFGKSNISWPTWQQSLYIGGQGEWARLWKAMQLDRNAALLSASMGGPQIMGFNYKKAGFTSVEEMWAKMALSEYNHLVAFCNFCKNSPGLLPALKRTSTVHNDNRDAAKIYNGEGYAKNDYHIKIAKAIAKWRAAWGV